MPVSAAEVLANLVRNKANPNCEISTTILIQTARPLSSLPAKSPNSL
jgi:hypothetical protein